MTARQTGAFDNTWGIGAAASCSALAAMALAWLGMTAVYAAALLAAAMTLAVRFRTLWTEPVQQAAGRLMTVLRPSETRNRPRSARREVRGALTAGFGCATVAVGVEQRAAIVLAAIAFCGLLAAAACIGWPWISLFFRDRPASSTSRAPAGRPGLLAVCLTALACAAIAHVLANLGPRFLVVAVALCALGGVLLVARNRAVALTFLTVCSLALVLHKALGPQDLAQSGGAIAVSITTFDAMVLTGYALWALEGTLLRDLRVAYRAPVLWLPLAALLLVSISILNAASPGHALAEIVRMGWMYLLYVLIAVRVRTRAHVWAVLAGLAVFVAIQTAVVILQWKTGEVLGLDFLGVPKTLGERTTDVSAIGRPFGTVVHPIFMAASLAMISLVALAVALHARQGAMRVLAGSVVMMTVLCMVVAQTRASLATAGLVGVAFLGLALRRRMLTWNAIAKVATAGLVLLAVFFEPLTDRFAANFLTDHFRTEVRSRIELNDIALRIIHDHVFIGVGLNNYEVVLPAYEARPVIFFGHPVHHLYLLYLAETGLIGLAGMLMMGGALLWVAIRLSSSTDPLFTAVGLGVAGAIAFLAIEETVGFSLRQDIPLALFWLMAGLSVACIHMSGLRWPPGLSPRPQLSTAEAPLDGAFRRRPSVDPHGTEGANP